MKKVLTKQEFHIVCGLFHLAKKYLDKSLAIEKELAAFLEYDDNYMGHISDEIASDYFGLENALKKEGIEIKK